MMASCTHCAQLERRVGELTEELEAWRSERARLRVEEAASDRITRIKARLRKGHSFTSGSGGRALLLSALMEVPGRLRSREALLRACALSEDVEEKLVDVHICELRKALKGLGLENIITTSWGRGYLIDEAAAERVKAAFPGLFE